MACILSCAVFAAISGSSIVTMLAIGSVMYPAMRQAGYDNKFTLGAIMSGGTLGIIIPPSIPMIIYGLVTETVGHRPVRRRLRPRPPAHARAVGLLGLVQSEDADRAPSSFAEFWHAFKDGIWAALMPVILLGGIYSRLLHRHRGRRRGAVPTRSWSRSSSTGN